MATSRLNRFWAVVIILLVAIIIIGGIVIRSRYSPAEPVEIFLPQSQGWQGVIHIDGAVNNPGFYPFRTGDSLEALIQAAGGTNASANLSGVELYIAGAAEKQEPQKIDINRAEAWLLEALPAIGKTLAQRIIDYRQKNGLFRNTDELLKVQGIGITTYERIKNLVTVGD